jgi:hypothetical protein
LQIGSSIVIEFGPYHRESRSKPCSIASARVNALKAEPACRPVPPLNVARFTWEEAKSFPPAIARMCPVEGSIATSAAPGSCRLGRCVWTARSASAWYPRSSEVVTCRPPPNTAGAPYRFARDSRTYWTKYSESPGDSIWAPDPRCRETGIPQHARRFSRSARSSSR